MISQTDYIFAGCRLATGSTGMMFPFIQSDESKRGRTICAGCGLKQDCKVRENIEPLEKAELLKESK